MRYRVQNLWVHASQVAWVGGCCGLLVLMISLFVKPPLLRAQIHPSSMPPALVDETQNNKAMGYTDSRKIVRDSVGNLYVAYRKKYKLHDETAYHIFVAKSLDNGSSWRVLNDQRPIESVGDLNQRVPAIAIDQSDGLHVVWYGPDETGAAEGENQIKYVHSTNGGESWSAWRNISFVAGYRDQPLWQEHPTLFINEANHLYVVWEGRDEWYTESSQIKFIKSMDGGLSWSQWTNIAPSSSSRSRPTLIATSEKLYLFSYGSRNGNRQILYASSLDDGHTWSGWQQVAANFQDQRHVSAAVDSKGMIHIVWRQLPFWSETEEDHSAQVYYATFDGILWSRPVRVGAHPGIAQLYPSIAVDHDETVWITWLETTDPYNFPKDAPTTGAVYYTAKSQQGWSAPIRFAPGNNNLYPSLRRNLTSSTEQIDVVWLETATTNHLIRFTQLQRPTTFLSTPKVAEGTYRAPLLLGYFAPTLNFNFAFLRSLAPLNFPQRAPWARDLHAIFTLISVVSLYVVAKFFVNRWLTMVFSDG
jgi:hypothetical protein